MVEVLIIAVIFGYSAWTLIRFFNKSKKGACASCSQNKSCKAACSDLTAAAHSKQEHR